MASHDVVQHRPRAVRSRARRPRTAAFKGFRYLFTTNIASYQVPVFATRGLIKGDAVGYYDEEEQELAVQLPGPGAAAEADRVLHEHLHALSAILLPPEKRLDENQVNTLSTGLIDTLTRNPDLWAFLVQRIAPTVSAEKRHVSDGSPRASSVGGADLGTDPAPTHS